VPDPRFEFRGDLGTSPVAEVLQTVHHYKVPGVLSVVKKGVEKKIFVWGGDVIFATSGDRADSLGDYLLRLKRISQEEFDRSVELLLSSFGAKRHGDILVEMGVLTATELFQIVQAQVRDIVYSVFVWEEGEVSFTVGKYRTEELVQLSIPIRQMVLEGVKAMEDVKRLVNVLGPSWTIFAPSFVPAEIGDVGLSPAEIRFLEQVDGARTLRELISSGPGDSPLNAKLMYAFFTLKLVSRREKGVGSAIRKIQLRTSGGDFASGG
jgi:hypothetical protein